MLARCLVSCGIAIKRVFNVEVVDVGWKKAIKKMSKKTEARNCR